MRGSDLANGFYALAPHGLSRAAYRFTNPRAFRSLQEFRSKVLKPFDEKEAIFVHIPKTAGIAIATAIFSSPVAWHLTIRPYQKMYDRQEFLRFFKFSFVRNPWDRALSAYFFLKDGGLNGKSRAWAAEHLARFSTFDDFARGWLRKSNIENVIQNDIQFYPQYKFLSLAHNSNLNVDYVGRFESINEDFEFVCARLGVKGELKRLNTSHRTSGREYRDYYTEASKKVIERLYERDIKIFGYRY